MYRYKGDPGAECLSYAAGRGGGGGEKKMALTGESIEPRKGTLYLYWKTDWRYSGADDDV